MANTLAGTGGTEVENTMTVIRIAGWSLALSLVALCALLGTAVAAPVFDVTLTRDQPVVSRSDERIDYTILVKNIAGVNPAAGSELGCNGASPPLGTKAWFRPATTGYSFEFQWLRNGTPATGWVSGAAGRNYVLTPADEGAAIQCLVKGTNGTGSGSFVVASQPRIVADPQPAVEPPAPNLTTDGGRRPTIAGPLKAGLETAGEWKAGEELRCTAPIAGWSESELKSPIAWTFQWLRDGAPAPGPATTVGTTISRYTLQAEDVEAPAAPAVFQCLATATNGGGAVVVESAEKNTKAPAPAFVENTADGAPFQGPAQVPVIEFGNTTSGPVTVELALPAGLDTYVFGTSGTGWSCTSEAASAIEVAKAICTRENPLPPGSAYPALNVAAALGDDSPDDAIATVTVEGGGGNSVTTSESFTFQAPSAFGVEAFSTKVVDAAGADYAQAGGHPFSASANIALTRHRYLRSPTIPAQGTSRNIPFELVRSVQTDLPPGFMGNPQAISEVCPNTAAIIAVPTACPTASAVGEVSYESYAGAEGNEGFQSYALFAIEPEGGVPAQFAFADPNNEGVYVLTPRLRPEGHYAVTVDVVGISEGLQFLGFRATLCGSGAKVSAGPSGVLEFDGCKEKSDAGAFVKPFLTNQTNCSDNPPITTVRVDSWKNPGVFHAKQAESPGIVGCQAVPFNPSVTAGGLSSSGESASGLEVTLAVPTAGFESQDGIAQSHLKRATVTLPKGLTVNPGSLDGLDVCTQSQLGMANGIPNNEPVKCPNASKIGTAEVVTPLLKEPLSGAVYLAKQGENPFGTLTALYLVVESKTRGILVKIPGKVEFKADGQVVSTFDDNPQTPFSSLKLKLNSGSRAPLMTPQRCGSYGIVSELTPWSAQEPDNPTAAETVTQTSTFRVESGPGGGECSGGILQPALRADLTHPVAGSRGPFVISLSRPDGSQRFSGLELTLPPGLTAALKGIPYCPDATLQSIPTAEGTGAAELANPSCPGASRIGSVAAGAGAGNPFYIHTGSAYLAGPYKGAPVSLAVVVPAVAGPFDLGNVVVRNAIYLDPRTAQITVKSDPLPTSLHNVQLDVRDIRVSIDRQNFTQAPTNCELMSVGALVRGEDGASAATSSRFQVAGCENLGFKPSLKLQLKGGTKRNKFQQLTATVTARPGDANIAGASVRFPRSIFLEQNHIRTVCTRVQFAADSCPTASIYGYAEAETPLLDQPLRGPVYMRSSDNPLPDIVAALRGPDHQPVEVELAGRVDSKNRGIRNTFDIVPDAPVSKFTLRMKGGKNSLLVSSRDLCLRKERAAVKMRGQNGMVRDFRPVVKVKCKKKKQQKQKKKQAQRGKKSR